MPASFGLNRLESVDPVSGRVNAVIDTPKGSRTKYKYDERTGIFRASKLLPLGAYFPYNFGFIPSTRAEDGDALDVLVLMDEPVVPGCVVPVILIGALAARQTEKDGRVLRNDRLLAVLETDYNPPEFRSLGALDKQRLDEIEHFFIAYNDMEGRRFEPIGRYGPDKAAELIKQYSISSESRGSGG